MATSLLRFLKTFGLFFAGCVCAFLVAEGFCRFLLPISTVRYIYDSDVGTTLAPSQSMRWTNRFDFDNIVNTNSAGFHDVEHSQAKTDDTFRILLLGDSYMEALQVPIALGFSQQLQSRLRNEISHPKVEIINLALSGRGPAQHYRILEKKGLLYSPDLVLMAVLPSNDFRDSSPELNPASYKPLYRLASDGSVTLIPFSVPSKLSPRAFLQRSAFAYLLVYEIFKRPYLEKLFTSIGILPRVGLHQELDVPSSKETIPLAKGVYLNNPPPIWRDAYAITLRMILETKRLAENFSSEFLLFSIPTKNSVENIPDESFHNLEHLVDFNRPFDELRIFAPKHEIKYVDLTPYFQDDFQTFEMSHTWVRDGHWNERGHALAADVLADEIIPIILKQD
jgi:hypothetical protein